MPKSKEVDQWFSHYDNPMKPVVQRVRAIVLGADKRMHECIKWQAPTFTYGGNLASFFPKSKQHASLMFHEGARIPGKHPRLVGGGGTGRMLKIGSVAEANEAKTDIEAIVRAWCDWRDAAGKSQGGRPAAAKKATTKKPAAKSANARKATAKKPAAKRAVAKKAVAKKAARKRASTRARRTAQ
jgi:hypothetical protein